MLNFVTCWLRPLDKAALFYSFLQVTNTEQARARTQTNTRTNTQRFAQEKRRAAAVFQGCEAAAGPPSTTVSGLVQRMLLLLRATFLSTLRLAQPVAPECEDQRLAGRRSSLTHTHTHTHSCTTFHLHGYT